ncbi:hypothetical protein [Sphingomonas profundi]|uniref:hypothetical protein n=1 Tax=Alterirhizorhabdus profundi TaxID=2681549 RepID=UPI0012E98955|nr:hypothetical protein [Sphingomonas profundi]
MTVKDTVKDTADRATTYASETLSAAGEKLHDAAGKVREGAGAARASVSETLESAKATAGETLASAREKTGAAYEGARDYAAIAAEAARDKANAAYASAKDTAATVRTRTADGIEESPLAVLIGGVAIGALLGALLPRTRREAEVLAPIGDKLGTLARNALAAAKEAGQDTLDELGVNKDGAKQQVDRLIDTASKAATSAGAAAKEAIRSPQG